MPDYSLEAVRSFHAELVAMAAMGLPVDLGLAPQSRLDRPNGLQGTLDSIALRIGAALNEGQELEEALDRDQQLSSTYRSALKTWLRCERSPVALDALTLLPLTHEKAQGMIWLSLAQPIVVLMVAYAASLFICTVTIPRVASLTDQFGFEPGPALKVLLTVREWLPVWAALLPVSVIVWLFLRRRRSGRMKVGLSDRQSSYATAIQLATYAERVAEVVSSGVSVDDALVIAGSSGRGNSLPNSSLHHNAPIEQTDASENRQSDSVSVWSGAVASGPGQLSPLLHWATSRKDSQEESTAAWRFSAQIYRHLANIRCQRLYRVVLPIFMVALCGCIALCTALGVFLPLVELLLNVANEA